MQQVMALLGGEPVLNPLFSLLPKLQTGIFFTMAILVVLNKQFIIKTGLEEKHYNGLIT